MANNRMPGADPIEDDLVDPMLDDDPIVIDPNVPADPAPADPVPVDPAPADPAPAPAEPAPEPEPPEQLIPISRLNKEIARRKALEERLMQEVQPFPAVAPELEPEVAVELPIAADSVKQMLELVLDNRLEDAAKLYSEQLKQVADSAARTAVKSVHADLDTRISRTTHQIDTTKSVKAVVAELKETYDAFEDSSENFDPRLTRMTLMLQEDYIRSEGYTPAQALRAAAEEAIMRFRPDLVKTPAPAADPAPVPIPPPAIPPQAIQKKLEIAAQQPPRGDIPRNRNAQAPRPNVMEMSDEEFDNLTTAELRRLRGDFV